MIEAAPQIHDRALDHLRRGRPGEAERLLRPLLAYTHVLERDYDDWLRTLAEAYRLLNRPRPLGYILVYLQRYAEAQGFLTAERSPLDAALLLELQARRLKEAQAEPAQAAYLRAGQAYLAAGHPALGAIALGAAGAHREAWAAWEQVLRDPRLRERRYEQALCHFNLGVAASRAGEPQAANRNLVLAQRHLEEVADDFESRGERERAFDCYAILLQLGRDSGSFENLAEGYINCVRVLKEDNLKFYVLQYYEDFLRLALEREEFHAAAAVLREAADYARRMGLIYDRGYMKRAAETWIRAAEKNDRDGASVELTENAVLAAIDCWNSLGDYLNIRNAYRRLSALPLADKKKQRYAAVAARYGDVKAQPIEAPTFPDYLRQAHAYPPIWELDLVEWELDGDYAAVCTTILGDLRYADMIRRRALNVLLLHLDAIGAEEDPRTLAQVAQGLGELQAYPALRPLERLYLHPSPGVRAGVMRALRHLYFKRTFGLIAKGLRDESKEVQKGALEAMAALHFPHAFDPLSRLYREHEDPAVKQVALKSIGAIATLEAGEFLIEVLRYDAEPLQEVARALLTRFDNPDIYPILRQHLELEGGALRPLLEQILRGAPARANP